MESLKKLTTETTALQIVAVIAWLWVMPAIDMLESYSYGSATIFLIRSYIPFVLGVILAVNIPRKVNERIWKPIFIIGCIILLFTIILQRMMWQLCWVSFTYELRIVGLTFFGYGLRLYDRLPKLKSFGVGVLLLMLLYGVYNLLIYWGHNIHPKDIYLWLTRDIIYGMTHIAIIILLWKTLSTEYVSRFVNKAPKLSIFVAGLFWGMILVVPADSYAPRWLSILMLFLAPVFAYIMTVIVRLSVKLISYVVKGIIENKFWWFESCCWWINKTDEV